LHHSNISVRYGHHIFIACDSVSTKVELADLLGAHSGLRPKPGKDLTRPIIRHFADGPPCLLVLDNMETAWEPTESHREIEGFLFLLADVKHLAIIISDFPSLSLICTVLS
jgi:hypothetical protein